MPIESVIALNELYILSKEIEALSYFVRFEACLNSKATSLNFQV